MSKDIIRIRIVGDLIFYYKKIENTQFYSSEHLIFTSGSYYFLLGMFHMVIRNYTPVRFIGGYTLKIAIKYNWIK
jgi:hypothetical protein